MEECGTLLNVEAAPEHAGHWIVVRRELITRTGKTKITLCAHQFLADSEPAAANDAAGRHKRVDNA